MPRNLELVNFNELPMHVTDMPVELGKWGIPKFIKKAARKGTRPFKRIARTATWPARKAYKTAVPRSVRRKIQRGARWTWRQTKKYGKFALLPILTVNLVLGQIGKAILKKLFGGAMKRLTRRRARYVAYQRRGTTRPTRNEMVESAQWSKKYARSKGLFGKLTAAFQSKARQAAKDPRVRAEITKAVQRKAMRRRRGARVRGECGFDGGDFVGAVITSSVVVASIPILMMIIKKFLGQAAQQGAPADPRQASPEQNLQPQLVQGYMENDPNYGRQAASMAMNMFNPPDRRQPPAQTYDYPEPEPQSFDFPDPPAEPGGYGLADGRRRRQSPMDYARQFKVSDFVNF